MGTIKLAREGCKNSAVEQALIGILILASLCYFLCWTLCIYFSKHGLDAKPYTDFKVGNLMLRIQVLIYPSIAAAPGLMKPLWL